MQGAHLVLLGGLIGMVLGMVLAMLLLRLRPREALPPKVSQPPVRGVPVEPVIVYNDVPESEAEKLLQQRLTALTQEEDRLHEGLDTLSREKNDLESDVQRLQEAKAWAEEQLRNLKNEVHYNHEDNVRTLRTALEHVQRTVTSLVEDTSQNFESLFEYDASSKQTVLSDIKSVLNEVAPKTAG